MSHPALAHVPKGWFHHGAQVVALVEQHRPAVTVELGTHRGGSAVPLARLVRTWGGVLYCVDTWAGVPKPGKKTWPHRIFECAANLKIAEVGASVRLIPATTAAAATAWVGPIDCLYIDADHSEAGVMADLEGWWPHVRSGGLVLGDDYDSPYYPGLTRAWDAFEQAHGLTFQRVATPDTHPPGLRLIYGVKP